MNIKNKTFLIFLVSSILIAVISSGLILFFYRSAVKDTIVDNIESVTHARVLSVDSLLQEKTEEVVTLSKDHHISDFIAEAIRQESPSVPDLWDPLKEGVRLYDHTLDALITTSHGLNDEVFILDRFGVTILSTYENKIGLDRSKKDYFINGKENVYIKDVFVAETTGLPSITISVPIFNPEDGAFVGVLVKRFEFAEFHYIFLDNSGLGETGEVYMLNKDGYMVTVSRFSNDSVVLNKVVDNDNTRRCFGLSDDESASKIHEQEHIGILDAYKNYNNIDVVGTHAYFNKMRWCVITEMSEEEVTGQINKIIPGFLIIIFGVILLSMVISWFSGRFIVGPLMYLKKEIAKVEGGNWDYEIKYEGKDEVESLIKTFNGLVDVIRGQKKDMDKTVSEQTENIVKNQEFLKKQQMAILNVLDDVENEKTKADSERDKLSAVLQNIGDGVFVVDKDLNIILFNKAVAVISGFNANDVLGKKYSDNLKFFCECKDGEQERGDGFILKAFQTGELQKELRDTFLIRKNGSSVTVSNSASPIKEENGDVVGVVVIIRDITKERQVEKMKTEFVSVASHQLRTPLTGIQWVAERLLKISTTLPEKEKSYISDVYSSAKRLSRLVDDLLNVSRIEEGRFIIMSSDNDVVKTVNDYLKETEPLITKKNLKVMFDKKPSQLSMFVDRNALQNIIQSIVSNAIEYTPAGGQIEIALEKKENTFVFSVADNGIGIPKEDQKTVFNKFSRGSNAQAVKTDGTGLGLYITKNLSEMLGGKAWFKSEVGIGTTFFVELPFKAKVLGGGKKV